MRKGERKVFWYSPEAYLISPGLKRKIPRGLKGERRSPWKDGLRAERRSAFLQPADVIHSPETNNYQEAICINYL
jgi:hypothetical protein